MKVKKITSYSLLIILTTYAINTWFNQDVSVVSDNVDYVEKPTKPKTQNTVKTINKNITTNKQSLYFITNKEIDDSFIASNNYPFFTEMKIEFNDNNPISFSGKLYLSEFDIVPITAFFEDFSLVVSNELFMMTTKIEQFVNEESETLSVNFNIYAPTLNIRRERYRILLLNEVKVEELFKKVFDYQKDRELEEFNEFPMIQEEVYHDEQFIETEPMIDETNAVQFERQEYDEEVIY
jgi:hypothetical protein